MIRFSTAGVDVGVLEVEMEMGEKAMLDQAVGKLGTCPGPRA